MKSLKDITSPEDIQTASIQDLLKLAEEIRERIIEVLSNTGGHLASNLGSVELTLALHHIFDSPKDKLIWDVSHQTYTHKLLTGRNDRFSTIRQFKGLSGFSHPKESPHDHFYAGHAGTALSLALGTAHNRDLEKRQEHVVPIIGDATLTCGMSLEALNNVSSNLERFIIVLNDNNMSISKNVGAITQILSRMVSNPRMSKWYRELEALVAKIPTLGASLSKQGHKITESLKNLFSSAAFFEQFGISYIGPIDGHDIKKLIDTFGALKDLKWPVLVHVLTNKGQGMGEAIKNPVSYHGVKPFNPETGKFLPAVSPLPTFPKVFGQHILEMAKEDLSLVVITPAMSAGSCLDAFMQAFPKRCFDVGIAEGHSLTFAGGLALGGQLKVVASIYATFLQRAFDNLFHDICLQELPVVLAIDRAGISGPDGATHHGIYDIGFLNAMPNLVIAQPRNGHVLKELFSSAFSWQRPVAIRYPNLPTEEPKNSLMKRELGKGEVLVKGKDLLIIALGHMNEMAFKIREELLKEDLEATILDPVFIKPLDTELLFILLEKHKKVVTLEEHSISSGLGAIFNHFLIRNQIQDVEVMNLGIPEAFLHHGSNKEILSSVGLEPKQITKRILVHWFEKKCKTKA